jgi:diguanylate cyclase (GGDEF)-like protein
MRQPVNVPARERALTLGTLTAACERARELATAEADAGEGLRAALRVLHEDLASAGAAVFVVEHGRLWLADSCGFAVVPDGVGFDEGIVGRSVRSGQPELVPDVLLDPDYVDVAPGVVSELALPLLAADGTAVGVLDIETSLALPEGAELAATPLASALAPLAAALAGAGAGDVAALARLFVYLGSLRDPRGIAQVVARSLSRVLPVETCQLLLAGDDGELVEFADWSSGPDVEEPVAPALIRTLRDRIEARTVLEVVDVSALRDAPHPPPAGVRSMVLAPLRAGGHELGLLVGTSRSARSFERHHVEGAALLAAHAGASLDAAFALDRERLSALTDPLTGLTNRRGFEMRLEAGLQRAQEERWPLSLVELDCDDFKEFNDRAGHGFGDAVLKEIGDVLIAVVPESGEAARLGGDEFVVMLPGVDAEAAHRIACDLQTRLIAGLADAGFPLRLSAGVATYPYDADRSSQLVRVVDQALYEAKALGKGHVVSFRELVRDGHDGTSALAPGSDRRRGGGGIDPALLEKTVEAATAIWAESDAEDALRRLAQGLTFVIGATGCVVSRVDGPNLVDQVRHALRDVDLGDEVAYLIDDFPVTKDVLESGHARAISFLDEDLDRGEAFVLRELQMNCCLLLPLRVDDRSWGLVEVYDMRMRRFEGEERAIAEFLVGIAGKRLEALDETIAARRRLPMFRLPWAGS